MNNKIKKLICGVLAVLAVCSALYGLTYAKGIEKHALYDIPRYEDVPAGHPADNAIHFLRFIGALKDSGDNRFGPGQAISQEAFFFALTRVMGWESAAGYEAVAAEKAQISPDGTVTRKEMARTAIKALGYDELAKTLDYIPNRYADVSAYGAYINMAADFGLLEGWPAGSDGMHFQPDAEVKKEEAAMLLAKLYERVNTPLKELHGFYAIKAYDQMGMIPDLTSVSFGWSRLAYDSEKGGLYIETTNRNGNEFALPKGFSEPVDMARQKGISTQLNLFASDEAKVMDAAANREVGMVEYLLSSPERQEELIRQAVELLNQTRLADEAAYFDGIVIDFENLRGDSLKQLFSTFLQKLKPELDKNGKKLYVAVHPSRGRGQAFYDGYDYRAIGEVADRVILMAHDYNAIRLTDAEMAAGYVDTPLTPFDEIYYALRMITDKTRGVADPGKIWLQISFDAVQWKRVAGKVVNRSAYRPAYTQIADRLKKDDPKAALQMKYSKKLENPWITYVNSEDGTDNIIWYEDSRSVGAKMGLARLFGIGGISVWRLGNIPDFSAEGDDGLYLDVWQKLTDDRVQTFAE